MDDYPARSVDTLKQRAHELETEIKRIRTEIQAAGNRERRPLLMNELRKARCRMDDLERQVDDVRSPVAPFFLF
jgi:hypothetical protein